MLVVCEGEVMSVLPLADWKALNNGNVPALHPWHRRGSVGDSWRKSLGKINTLLALNQPDATG